MATSAAQFRNDIFRITMGEFWSGDLGLTLISISLAALVFVITPLREAGLPGRLACEFGILVLMIFAAVTVKQSRIASILVILLICGTAVIIGQGRLHPSAFWHQVGCIFSTMTLLLYVRIVLLVMFRGGPVTWSRIQGGVSAYLLLGMAWASAYQFLEAVRPGSFHFVAVPGDFDQLISKMTYFSFSVLTTLGGEVAPVSPFARSLTVAEAIVGQLFPAIIIGALVAMAMQSRSKA